MATSDEQINTNFRRIAERLNDLVRDVARLKTQEVAGNFRPGSVLAAETTGGVSDSLVLYKNSNGEIALKVGVGATGNRYAYIDFIGDDAFIDFGLRLIRGNIGVNAESALTHRGQGTLRIEAIDGGRIKLLTPAHEWQSPALLNNWSANSPGTNTPPQYRIDAENVVHLRGVIQGGTIGLSTPCMQLPVGFRPSYYHYFPLASNSAFGASRIDPNGQVHIITGSTTWVSLDSIAFRIDA